MHFICLIDIRLASTDNRPNSGRLEIHFNNEWGQICYQNNATIYSVACAQIGYTSTNMSIARTRLPSVNPRIWLEDIQCVGNEETLLDCGSHAGISSIGKLSNYHCTDGTVAILSCLSGKL